MGWYINYYQKDPCISVQSYATNELEHTHAASEQQKDAVWWGGR